MKTLSFRPAVSLRQVCLLALSLAAIPLLSVDSFAQGNSPNTPAAENSQGLGGQGVQPGGGMGGTAPVPEPATWAAMITLAVVGGGLAYRSARNRRRAAP